MSRHATDRTDWTLLAKCPNNGEHVEGETDPEDPIHIAIEASAEHSLLSPLEAVPVEEMECGICDAKLDIMVQEEPSEVLY